MKYFFEIKNYIIKYKNIIFFSFILIVLFSSVIFTYYVYKDNNKIKKGIESQVSINTSNTESNNDMEDQIIEEVSYVFVDIKGYVKNPGVYKVESDKRVNDVVALAGGLIKNANTKYINLSKKVSDEMVIIIYSNQEIKEMLESDKTINTTVTEVDEKSETSVEGDSKLVNINSASEIELMTLSGIGEAKAKAIIDYRTENGSFTTIEDIMKVSGISESTYSKIKTFITV